MKENAFADIVKNLQNANRVQMQIDELSQSKQVIKDYCLRLLTRFRDVFVTTVEIMKANPDFRDYCHYWTSEGGSRFIAPNGSSFQYAVTNTPIIFHVNTATTTLALGNVMVDGSIRLSKIDECIKQLKTKDDKIEELYKIASNLGNLVQAEQIILAALECSSQRYKENRQNQINNILALAKKIQDSEQGEKQ